MGRRTHPLPLELLLPIGPKELSFYFLIYGPDATCGNIFERWQITDLPDSLFFPFLKKKERKKRNQNSNVGLLHTLLQLQTPLSKTRPQKKREKRKKKKKKEDRSCRSRHVEPTTIIGCKPIYIPLFILLFCSAPSLFLSLIISLSLSHWHTHTDPETLEFPCSVVQIFVENLYWFSVVSENRGGF